ISTWLPSWTGQAARYWPGGCRIQWIRSFASKLWRRHWQSTARPRSSIPIRVASSPRRASRASEGSGREDIHGRQGALDGQCFHRTALAVAEVRVRLSAPIRDRDGGTYGDRRVDKILWRAAPAFGARRADTRRGLRGRWAIFHKRDEKTQKAATTETGGLTAIKPSLIPPPGSLTNRGHLTVLDLVDDGGKLAAHSAVQPLAEDLRDLVRRQPPQPELAASLEQLVDREVALEDEVATVFDLGDRVEARQIDLLALFLGELRPQNEGPVVEPLANDFGLSLSAAACNAATSSTAKNALSSFRNPIFARLSSCSMKLCPLR